MSNKSSGFTENMGVSDLVRVEITTDEPVVEEIVEKNKFINLDIGCGGNKQPGFVGMDKRKLPGVDIVHDLEVFPYPLKDGVVNTIIASHVVEHIKPWLMIDFMNELWRILKVGGQLAIAVPYGWSYGYLQDPTHCNPCVEATFTYFVPSEQLYRIYEPKLFEFGAATVWQNSGQMEVLLKKITEEEGKIRYTKMLKDVFGIDKTEETK